MDRYDTAIIGSGPAGLEAALNLKIRKKNFLLFGTKDLSRKIHTAPRIDNYLGIPSVSGNELSVLFLQHLELMGIAIREERVIVVYPMGDYFSIATAKGTYEARTVILATGAHSDKPIPGEEKYLGCGVGYCATCDAPLYKGKTVAVVGYSDDAASEANFISELASKTYYIPMQKTVGRLEDNVVVISEPAVSIEGDGTRVTALVLKERKLEIDGVFLLRESLAPAALVPGLTLSAGFIHIDKDMQTNIPGCYAAGDCTGKPHQYMRAAGQGQTAALNAVLYLQQTK